jgi:hypothetical protein
MNSNWLRGYGTPPPQTVIASALRDGLSRMFASFTWAGALPHSYGVANKPSTCPQMSRSVVTCTEAGRLSGRTSSTTAKTPNEAGGFEVYPG